MLANIGDLPYLVVIALIVLVGGSQLPKIARNVGLAGKEFRQAQADADAEAERERQAKAAALAPASLPAAGESGEGALTLTPAQLDALLNARAEQVRESASLKQDN
jgi:Sec-independent protein translocase protein TatA